MVVALLVANLVALTVALLLLWGQRRRARRAPALPVEAAGSTRRAKRRLIVVEILNPLELAAAESRFGKVAGDVAPAVTHGIVIDRVVARMREQFSEEGVVAQVDIQVVG